MKFVREDAIFGQSNQDKAERKRPKNLVYPLRLVFGQTFFPRVAHPNPGCGMIDEELQVRTSEGEASIDRYRLSGVLDAVFQENCICASSNLCEPGSACRLNQQIWGTEGL